MPFINTQAPASATQNGPNPARPQWLVSVRNLAEAELASEFGVDILDVKEPASGALAPASPQVWKKIGHWNTTRNACPAPLSAALGESDQARTVAEKLPAAFGFAKVGPSGCATTNQLRNTWDQTRKRLPRSTELVAVAYADHHAASCLPIQEVLELAIQQGFGRILVDTFDKGSGSSFDQMQTESLIEFGRRVHQARLWWALAGSITLSQVRCVNEQITLPVWRPHCFAVRGDVCQDTRTTSLSRQRLQAWRDVFSHHSLTGQSVI